MTNVNTAALREMLAEVGREEWEAAGECVRTKFSGEGGWLIADCAGVTITSGAKLAMLIAALRKDAPTLLGNTDRLAALEAGMRGLVDSWRGIAHEYRYNPAAMPATAQGYEDRADELSALLNRPANGGE